MTSQLRHLLSPAAFQDALKNGHYAKAIKALKAGQDIHEKVPTAFPTPKPSPLALMWRWENQARALEVMELLLEAGADPNLPDEQGRRPLHTWLWLGDAPKEAIDTLIHAGANPLYKSIITPNEMQQSALQVCVIKGLAKKVGWLCETIPDIGARHDEHWEEPIMRWAIQNTRTDTPEHRQILLDLLGSGANIDAVDKFGRSGRTELLPGFQTDIVNQWEEMVRAKQEAGELNQCAPAASLGSNNRRM